MASAGLVGSEPAYMERNIGKHSAEAKFADIGSPTLDCAINIV